MIGGQNPNLPVRYGASYKSNTALAANTPETIFTPAANVNGAIVWMGTFLTGNGSSNGMAGYLAKSSAPTSALDGDVISSQSSSVYGSTAWLMGGGAMRPVFIPAGKGLYFIATVAELSGIPARSVLYTLL